MDREVNRNNYIDELARRLLEAAKGCRDAKSWDEWVQSIGVEIVMLEHQASSGIITSEESTRLGTLLAIARQVFVPLDELRYEFETVNNARK